ncbi:hypothetical protein Ahy_A01g003190 [Arachis hypogaea]|uniref:Uncharacterized protein n=1 Tax=Arachis hypogaea TaxID=3818 RepID=A0A445ESE1_ARAHY|nr:hypothetical protein Ahy_A01g003190 [Arachis hypogaea]
MKRLVNWILDVGNGNIGSVVGDELEIEISDDLLITTTNDPLSHFGTLCRSKFVAKHSRAILVPTLERVEKVNDFVLTIFSEKKNEYLSSDTTC